MTGFIGGGNMAEAMIRGMIDSGRREILISDPSEERRIYLNSKYSVKTVFDNKGVISSSSLIILAVKPQMMEEVLNDFREFYFGDKIVVSIAAGIKLSWLQSRLACRNIIRAMPNTGALVLEGMSVLSCADGVFDEALEQVRSLFLSIGKVLVLTEDMMDAVTALSGSGPAFVASFIESMIAGAEDLGLDRENATILAVQTLKGTAGLLNTNLTPGELIKMVTSPGGTTEAGLKVLRSNGLNNVIMDTLKAAFHRSQELGKS